MVDQKYLDKAEVLIEALPYIRRFHDKIIVVKYGGSAMIDEELKREVIQDVVLLKLVGFRPIIVHGGGKEISRWVDKAGKETEFVGGLRVTDKETIEIAQMVLGKVNKDLVANVQTLGVQAAGISGMDGGMLKVEKKYVDGRDIGYVGDIKSVDTKILHDLMEQDYHEKIKIAEEEFYASIARGSDAVELGIAEGSPVLTLVRTTYNVKNMVVEYTHSVARADQFTYKVTHVRS